MSKPIVMFTPETLIAALDKLTNEQAGEMNAYASQGDPPSIIARG